MSLLEMIEKALAIGWIKKHPYMTAIIVLTALCLYEALSMRGVLPLVYFLPNQSRVVILEILFALLVIVLLFSYAWRRYVWMQQVSWLTLRNMVITIVWFSVLMGWAFPGPLGQPQRYIIVQAKDPDHDPAIEKQLDKDMRLAHTGRSAASVPRVLTVGCLPLVSFPCFSTPVERLTDYNQVILIIKLEADTPQHVRVTHIANGFNLNLLPTTLPNVEQSTSNGRSDPSVVLSQKDYKRLASTLLLYALSHLEQNPEAQAALVQQAADLLGTVSGTDQNTIWQLYEQITADLLERGRHKQALAIAESLITRYQGEARLYNLVAKIQEEVDVEDAIEQYRNALQRDPQLSESLRGLGRVSLKLDRFADAICYTSEARKLSEQGNDRNALKTADHLLLAAAYDRLGLEGQANEQRRLAKQPPIGDTQRIEQARLFLASENYDHATQTLQRVLGSDDRRHRANALVLLGRAYNYQGNYDAATEQYDTFLNEFGNDEKFADEVNNVYIAKADNYMDQGEIGQAYEYYKRAKPPSNQTTQRVTYLRSIAIAARRLASYSEAKDAYEEALALVTDKQSPEYAEMLVDVAENLQSLGETDLARERMQETIQLYNTLIEQYVGRASQDWQGCEYVNTLYNHDPPLYTDLLPYKKSPRVPEAFYRYQRYAYNFIGDQEAASRNARKEIDLLTPKATTAVDFANLGALYVAAGGYEPEVVIAAFQKAIDLDNPLMPEDPADASDYSWIAGVYYGEQQYDEAIAAYRRAVELQRAPDSKASNLASLSRVYRDKKEIDKAVQALTEAIQIEPDQQEKAGYYNEIGDIQRGKQAFGPAIEAYQQAIALQTNSQQKAAYYSKIGDIQRGEQAFDAAIEAYQQAIALQTNPQAQASSYVQLGFVYRDQQNYDEAINAFIKAIELKNPDLQQTTNYWLGQSYFDKWAATKEAQMLDFARSAFVAASDYYRIGLVDVERGEFQSAIENFQKAIERDGDVTDVDSYYQLSRAYQRLGQDDAANSSADKCIALEKQLGVTLRTPSCQDMKVALAQSWKTKAAQALEDEDYTQLGSAIEQFLKFQPNDTTWVTTIGEQLIRQTKYAEAESVLRLARKNGNDRHALFWLAWSLYEQAKDEDARGHFELCTTIYTSEEDSYYLARCHAGWGLSLVRLGDIEGAKPQLELARSLGKDLEQQDVEDALRALP